MSNATLLQRHKKTTVADSQQFSAPLQAKNQSGAKLSSPHQLVDHRPQTQQLQALQRQIVNSPRASQLKTMQRMSQASAAAAQLNADTSSFNQALLAGAGESAPVQAKAEQSSVASSSSEAAATQANQTGLPDNLKAGIESLSDMSMDHVNVHYNSSQPAQLNAHAYAQGSDIHVAPGQEKHLPHEAWHVVQQAQGRVKPTMQMKAGVAVNDDAGLEAEADQMGAKALGVATKQIGTDSKARIAAPASSPRQAIQKNAQIISSSLDANVQKKALNSAKVNNNAIVQKYDYDPTPAEITVHHPKGTQKWTESISSEVSWNKGEKMDPNNIGSHKVANRDWKGLLKNQSNGNNATGLHVVNANWGGSGDALNGNIVPGTPSLNGHHKSIENEVHNLFINNGGKAPDNMSYKADVITPYPQVMDLTKKKSGDVITYDDPSIKCTVKVGANTPVDNEEVKLGGGTKIVVP